VIVTLTPVTLPACRSGWPDEFEKKIAQNVAQAIFYPNLYKNWFWATSVIFKILPKKLSPPKRRKFGQFGHPACVSVDEVRMLLRDADRVGLDFREMARLKVRKGLFVDQSSTKRTHSSSPPKHTYWEICKHLRERARNVKFLQFYIKFYIAPERNFTSFYNFITFKLCSTTEQC
jgi:hypothetical protein